MINSARLREYVKEALRFFFGNSIVKKIQDFKAKRNYRIMTRQVDSYLANRREILNRIQSKEIINLLFFVNDMGMWKYDSLFRLLVNKKRYNPTIVPFYLPFKTYEVNKANRDETVDYCKQNRFPYRDCFDFENRRYLDISDINPDIVFYTQPYNIAYKDWKIEEYMNHCLFIYTPYGVSLDEGGQLYDNLLMNIAWKIFTANELDSKAILKFRYNKIDNTVVTGVAISDAIKNISPNTSPWSSDSNKLKIIWAPHHTIFPNSGFYNSTFDMLSSFMLEIADKYQDMIEIAFKPHPRLYDILLNRWGQDKTDLYYGRWERGKNTFLVTGEYISLFAFSDALIHDCCSFAFEYLIVNKPALYMCNSKSIPNGINNELGRACFDCHYHGYSTEDVEAFINMIINHQDKLSEKRTEFIKNNMTPPNGLSTAENMMNQLDIL